MLADRTALGRVSVFYQSREKFVREMGVRAAVALRRARIVDEMSMCSIGIGSRRARCW